MSLFLLTTYNSLANDFIAELRDKNLQKDSMRFRRNMKHIGELLAYEISKTLDFKKKTVYTPLGKAHIPVIRSQPYLITILRAGLPFFEGFSEFFDKADCGFIGSYRTEFDDNLQFDIKMGYTAIGDTSDKNVIIIDPMLASGRSILKAVDHIVKTGRPRKFHIASLIAAEPGYRYLKDTINYPVDFWFGDIDEKLNEKSYIVPGLGDAGDLCFGKKK